MKVLMAEVCTSWPSTRMLRFIMQLSALRHRSKVLSIVPPRYTSSHPSDPPVAYSEMPTVPQRSSKAEIVGGYTCNG